MEAIEVRGRGSIISPRRKIEKRSTMQGADGAIACGTRGVTDSMVARSARRPSIGLADFVAAYDPVRADDALGSRDRTSIAPKMRQAVLPPTPLRLSGKVSIRGTLVEYRVGANRLALNGLAPVSRKSLC